MLPAQASASAQPSIIASAIAAAIGIAAPPPSTPPPPPPPPPPGVPSQNSDAPENSIPSLATGSDASPSNGPPRQGPQPVTASVSAGLANAPGNAQAVPSSSLATTARDAAASSTDVRPPNSHLWRECRIFCIRSRISDADSWRRAGDRRWHAYLSRTERQCYHHRWQHASTTTHPCHLCSSSFPGQQFRGWRNDDSARSVSGRCQWPDRPSQYQFYISQRCNSRATSRSYWRQLNHSSHKCVGRSCNQPRSRRDNNSPSTISSNGERRYYSHHHRICSFCWILES